MRGLALLALGLCLQAQAWAQSVLFINPGRADEAYWATVSDSMVRAARSLGMSLDIRYAGRNHLQMIALAREVAALPQAQRPRFVIFSNEYSVAPELLRTLEAAEVDSLIAFSGVQAGLAAEVGRPREKFRHWLGSLEPRAEDAGYLTAKALIAAARRSGRALDHAGRLQLLAISGNRSTPTSVERGKGMRRAVEEAGDVVLVQEVFGEWRSDRAAEQARVLLQRYPEVRTIWAGNDEMAFGAMQAWRERGGTPGQDGFFSAINTSPRALAARRSGELAALAGGHFMAGAWAMVVLYDYARGHDFRPEGLELQKPMFVLFDELLIERFEQRLVNPAAKLDFRRYSKALNPKLTRYNFHMEHLLR